MKKAFTAIIVSFLFGVAFSVINCNGTRFRTAENNFTSAQVMANLNSLSSLSPQSLDGGQEAAMLTQFISDLNGQTGYSLYYSESPSEMASIPTQIADFAGPPQNFAGFPTAPTLPVSHLWIYFIVSGDGTQAGLVIAGVGGSTQAAPTPIPTATPVGGTTTSTTAATTPTATPNFYYVALNDGSSFSTGSLQAGSFSSVDYDIDLNLDGVSTLTLQTEDLSNGDLADTLQFDVYNTSGGTYIGRINVTQPAN